MALLSFSRQESAWHAYAKRFGYARQPPSLCDSCSLGPAANNCSHHKALNDYICIYNKQIKIKFFIISWKADVYIKALVSRTSRIIDRVRASLSINCCIINYRKNNSFPYYRRNNSRRSRAKCDSKSTSWLSRHYDFESARSITWPSLEDIRDLCVINESC